MSGYLQRMVGRSFGSAPTVQPLIRSHYAPGPEVLPADAVQGWSETWETQSIEPTSPQGNATRGLREERHRQAVLEVRREADESSRGHPVPTVQSQRMEANARPQDRALEVASADETAAGLESAGRAPAARAAEEPRPRVSAPDPSFAIVEERPRGNALPLAPIRRQAEAVSGAAVSRSERRAPMRERDGDKGVLEIGGVDAHPGPPTVSLRLEARTAEGAPNAQQPDMHVSEKGSLVLESQQGRALPSSQPRPAASLEQLAQPRPPAVPGREPAQPDRRSAPVVRVTIGRIEVRAVAVPESRPARQPAARPAPDLSLEDYLKQRNGS